MVVADVVVRRVLQHNNPRKTVFARVVEARNGRCKRRKVLGIPKRTAARLAVLGQENATQPMPVRHLRRGNPPSKIWQETTPSKQGTNRSRKFESVHGVCFLTLLVPCSSTGDHSIQAENAQNNVHKQGHQENYSQATHSAGKQVF